MKVQLSTFQIYYISGFSIVLISIIFTDGKASSQRTLSRNQAGSGETQGQRVNRYPSSKAMLAQENGDQKVREVDQTAKDTNY